MDNKRINSHYLLAAEKALKSFPIQAENIEFIEISENVTFRIKVTGSDTDYSLRLHRPGYNSIDELESERMWTKALSGAGIIVQEGLQSSHNQKYYVLIDIPGIDEQRYAGITTWVEGIPLSVHLENCASSAEQIKQFRRLGEIIATMHNQTTAWNAAPHFERRRLDVDSLLGEDPFWGRFWEHPELSKEEQDLLIRTRDDLRDCLNAYSESANNFSLIHADLNTENLIYTGEDLAVIDFDDSAYGWHIYDLTAAFIEFVSELDIDQLQKALLEG